jgi:uracil-DNA glycosylase family 4
MANYVQGYGSSSAKIVIVGEAPGAHEDAQGRPFVGPAGNILDDILQSAGIDRDSCYLTNVCKVRPPDNDLTKLKLIGQKIEDFLPQLWQEIEGINPNIIFGLGNTALQYLTGNRGIEKWRGSIQSCTRTGHKTICSLHPASLLHETGGSTQWKELTYIKLDAKRVAEQSLFRDIRLPQRVLSIARNSLDVIRFFERYADRNEATLDVETFKTYPLCIGLSFSPYEGMSIPLFDDRIVDHDLAYIWKLLADFLRNPHNKIIAQNAKFDEKRCRQIGLRWHDCYFDTAMGWHVCYSELPKRLQFISSVLTEEPYYKDEGSEYNPKKDNIDRLFSYNAKDAVVEFECFEKISQDLKDLGMWDFFFDRIMPLHRLYSDLEDVGILIDKEIKKGLGKKYEQLREACHARNLERIRQRLGDPGYEFNCNSPKQVGKMLYGDLNCPSRRDTGEDTLKALANNAVKDEARKSIILDVLEERKIAKSIGTYINAELSDDDRMHTQVNINGTESGRTSTSSLKPPVSIKKEGWAFQTLTKHEDITLGAGGGDLRSMCIADSGYVFMEADLSQAEDRVVAVLSKDFDAFKELNRTDFIRNSHGIRDDRHTKTAMQCCSMAFEAITDYYRQIGKKTRHAGNYDMGKHMAMTNFAKFGVFLSEWKCGKFIEAFHDSNPKIRGVFHLDIQQALASNDCILFSPHGRRRQFFNRWGTELFKEAYSYIPQATVSDQTKFAMVSLSKIFPKKVLRFVQESHDSFLALVHEDWINLVAKTVKEELEQPIDFSRCTLSRDYKLVIPCEIKIGHRWVEKSQEFSDGMSTYKAVT